MIELIDNKWIHTVEFGVRDYEIDSEGIVNNANYLHYIEHARHCFCQEAGMSFAAMRAEGMMPVVSRLEVNYRTPLRSGDVAHCRLWVSRRGPRFEFHQSITNQHGVEAINAKVTIVTIADGKLSRGDELAAKFANYLSSDE